jgi:arylsulfatase A-like enzyme
MERTRKLRIAAWWAPICFAVAILGCGEPAPPDPRLVVLYVPCTVNRLFLSPYDDAVEFTPNFARFASEGTVFARHQSEAGQSAIAYASILTGTHADQHGIFSQPTRLDDSLGTIVEAFAAAGYETFFWAGHAFTAPAYGFTQGAEKERVFESALDARDPVFRKILSRLSEDPDYKAFVFTSFSVTHAPYGASQVGRFCADHPQRCTREDGTRLTDGLKARHRFYLKHRSDLSMNYPETIERLGLEGRKLALFAATVEMLYASNVYALDRRFGALLDAIDAAGVGDASLVAMTADHGETLHRPNALFKWMHGWQLSPEALQVPWIVRSARVPAGDRFEPVTASIDVFPTLLGLAGVAPPAGIASQLAGRDLSASLAGAAPPAGRPAYSHTTVLDRRFAHLVEGRTLWRKFHDDVETGDLWVSVRNGDTVTKYRKLDGDRWGFEVFDHTADPAEESNLYDASDPDQQRTTEALIVYRDRIIAAWRRAGEQQVLDPRAIDELRELGYVD